MDLGLKGKVALIAAASRGLGRAVAEELAAEGVALVLCARGAEALNETREVLVRNTGADVLALTADVGEAGDVWRVVNAGLKEFGRIDILVNNAGGPPAGRFESLSREQWDAATRLTLYSAIELTRNVLPGMRERRWGAS